MNNYETVFILNPVLSDDQIEEAVKKYENLISKLKAKIIVKENWGLKDLSYAINNYKKAFYKYYQIEIIGSELKSIKKTLTQNEKILRHLFIKVDEHQTLPTKMSNNEEK